MTDAYVNVIAEAGAVPEAAREIAGLDTVTDVRLVTGEHDIVVELELDDRRTLPGVVAGQIGTVDGVVDTVTNVAYEP